MRSAIPRITKYREAMGRTLPHTSGDRRHDGTALEPATSAPSRVLRTRTDDRARADLIGCECASNPGWGARKTALGRSWQFRLRRWVIQFDFASRSGLH